MSNASITAEEIAGRLSALREPGRVLVVGLTGSVAAGKSTLGAAMANALAGAHTVEVIPTDGFLYPNAILGERGLMMRKGYPETYDAESMVAAINAARHGPVTFPAYSHMTYDIDRGSGLTVDRPDILILEGLGLSPQPDGRNAAAHLDTLIYLDADEADLEAWFVTRFLDFWRAAEHEPASFYAQFRAMTEPQVEVFAGQVWTGINLPNLREHIIRARDGAHLVLKKSLDHTLTLQRG